MIPVSRAANHTINISEDPEKAYFVRCSLKNPGTSLEPTQETPQLPESLSQLVSLFYSSGSVISPMKMNVASWPMYLHLCLILSEFVRDNVVCIGQRVEDIPGFQVFQVIRRANSNGKDVQNIPKWATRRRLAVNEIHAGRRRGSERLNHGEANVFTSGALDELARFLQLAASEGDGVIF